MIFDWEKFSCKSKIVRKKMKNKIKYGRSPENGYQNRGGFTMA